ncbi:MAG TPA: aldehyde dehydrogenase family protein [Planctomycetes bacterium]|nr:aldehyde dehydrogenase family protein [Planctomycetota bacterium]
MDAVNFSSAVAELRQTFNSGHTRHLSWRREQLRALKRALEVNEQKLLEALHADLGKPEVEAYAGEIGFLMGEIDYTIKHLASWAKPEKVKTPLVNAVGKSEVLREPLGVVLVIGPWNYPIQLVLAPLVGAIAAGNCAVLKPSELAPASSAAVAELVEQTLDPRAVKVVEGGVPETSALLAERWDHVFFTGSTRVGRIVYEAAAKHLTPVTLELGGKSPCVVDAELDLEPTARRIVWGKFFNTGQTCVAPDYVLVHRDQEQALLNAMKATLREFYGADPKQSPDYGRIVNSGHHQRLVAYLEGADVFVGGEHDADERYLAPTILRNVKPDDPVMQEEIFGPILPVLVIDSVDEAISFINAREKPLALYVFTSDKANAERVLQNTSSGGACVNDAISHLAVPELPFGGVGESGMGAYHGSHSFETFSHRKSVLKRWTWPDVKLRYPPYADKLEVIKKVVG